MRQPTIQYHLREEIDTEDGDFLILDRIVQPSSRCVIISHGLEGNSRRHYVVGMANYFAKHGWDAIAWNFRGCGGKPNRLLKSYHSGATEDLHTVVQYAQALGYQHICLVGFSMGGNMTLKYLSEQPNIIEIKSSIAISVPLDLKGCAIALAKPTNAIYMKRFLNDLTAKLKEKKQRFKELNLDQIEQIKTFQQFDDRYTAPLHGFKDAEDYWSKCSALFHLQAIQTPSLLINALDDPFLSSSCYPTAPISQLETDYPRWGGHVGFFRWRLNQSLYSEQRALAFAQQGFIHS